MSTQRARNGNKPNLSVVGDTEVVGNGEAAMEFDPLLPSTPILAPAPGDQGKIGFVYNLERVMNLDRDMRRIVKPLTIEQEANFGELDRLRDEFQAAWGPLMGALARRDLSARALVEQVNKIVDNIDLSDEDKVQSLQAILVVPEEDPELSEENMAAYQAARAEHYAKLREINDRNGDVGRRMSLMLLSHVIARIEWPFKGAPPDFSKPETVTLSDAVLAWLIHEKGGLKEARSQINGPLLVQGF